MNTETKHGLKRYDVQVVPGMGYMNGLRDVRDDNGSYYLAGDVDEVVSGLLEAAYGALFAFGRMGANGDVDHPQRKEWDALRAAIAKAEGRS